MSIQKHLQLIKKREFHSNYLLVGEETYLQSLFLSQLMTTLSENEELDLTNVDLNDVPVQSVIDEAELYSFFADYRLVIVENATFLNAQTNQKLTDHQQENLLSYLENPNPNTIVVWRMSNGQFDKRKKITKQFQKYARLVDVNIMEEKATKQFLEAQVKERQLNLSQQALDVLLVRVQYNLSLAMNELSKLNSYALSGNQVTVEVIEQLVPRVLESDVFELTNALIARNARLATQVYQDLLLMKHEPIAILALLISQFRIIIQSALLAQTGQLEQNIATQLNVHSYRVKLALQSARKYPLASIMALYEELIKADYQLKTGIGDRETFFYLIVTKFMMM